MELPQRIAANARTLLAVASGCAICVIIGWLGMLHGYYPARRVRTIFVCAAFLALVWFCRHWLKGAIRVVLVVALVVGCAGTASGYVIHLNNIYNAELMDRWGIETDTPGVTMQCLPLGLSPCQSYIDYPTEPTPMHFEIKTECLVPFFLCATRFGIE